MRSEGRSYADVTQRVVVGPIQTSVHKRIVIGHRVAAAWGIFKWGEPSLGFSSMGVFCVQSESDFAMDCCRNGGENIRADTWPPSLPCGRLWGADVGVRRL